MLGGGARASGCGAFPKLAFWCVHHSVSFFFIFRKDDFGNSVNCEEKERPADSVSCWKLFVILTGQASLICRQRQGWKPSRDREPDRPESHRDFHVTARPYPLLPAREIILPRPFVPGTLRTSFFPALGLPRDS